MRLTRPGNAQVFALLLVISSCVVGSPTIPEPSNNEQDKSVSGAASPGGAPAEPTPAIPEDELVFSPEPRKFEGLEEFHRGPIAVQVRMAEQADLADFGRLSFAEGMTLAFGSIILVGAAFGAAALPLLGAYAAWGAIFFGGVAPGMSAVEQHRQSSIAEAIGKVDFPRIAQTALQRRLGETIVEAGPETETLSAVERQIEVVVLSYGFVWSGAPDTACAFLRAQFRVTIPNFATQKDWVYIEPSQRSNDAPPAYCSYAKKLFADNSALARQTLSESAEILAAVVAKRLEVGR